MVEKEKSQFSLLAKAEAFLSEPDHQIGVRKNKKHSNGIIDVTNCEYCRTIVLMAAFANSLNIS